MPCVKMPKTIKIRNETFVPQITTTMYNETQDDTSWSCDAVIKCGPELFEYYCHRVILASSSELLWHALSNSVPGTLPVIILPDVKPKTLKHVLNFIYNGQLTIPLVEYPDIFEACELLGVKGICRQEEQKEEEQKEEEEIEVKNELIIDEDEIKQEMSDLDEDLPRKRRILRTRSARNTCRPKSPELVKKKSPNGIRNMVKLKPDEKREHLKRVKKSIFDAYSGYGKRFGDSKLIEANANETRLVMAGDFLVRAEHTCAVCGFVLSMNYLKDKNCTKIKSWPKFPLQSHLQRAHGLGK